jgi:PIN like domain
VTYFLDNTFPPQFAASLRPFGHDIHRLLDVVEFRNRGATKDEEWMPFVGERGWITLTSDRRIVANQRQREISSPHS